jgi:hypothetical protein
MRAGFHPQDTFDININADFLYHEVNYQEDRFKTSNKASYKPPMTDFSLITYTIVDKQSLNEPLVKPCRKYGKKPYSG